MWTERLHRAQHSNEECRASRASCPRWPPPSKPLLVTLNTAHIAANSPCSTGRTEFQVNFEGKADDPKVTSALQALRQSALGVQMVAPKVVPWFPTRISDIDSFSTKTLDAGAGEWGWRPVLYSARAAVPHLLR